MTWIKNLLVSQRLVAKVHTQPASAGSSKAPAKKALYVSGCALILVGILVLVALWFQPLGGSMLAGNRHLSGEQFLDLMKKSGIDPNNSKQYGVDFSPMAARVEYEQRMRIIYSVFLLGVVAAGAVLVRRSRK